MRAFYFIFLNFFLSVFLGYLLVGWLVGWTGFLLHGLSLVAVSRGCSLVVPTLLNVVASLVGHRL